MRVSFNSYGYLPQLISNSANLQKQHKNQIKSHDMAFGDSKGCPDIVKIILIIGAVAIAMTAGIYSIGKGKASKDRIIQSIYRDLGK